MSSQVVLSPFIFDDGTAKFGRVTNELLVVRSGVCADWRTAGGSLSAMNISTTSLLSWACFFLEDMVLFLCAMKPRAYLFGATLIAASGKAGAVYRIDPPGWIECLWSHVVIVGDTTVRQSAFQQLQHTSKGALYNGRAG